MKVVLTSNHGSETIAEMLLIADVSQECADKIANDHNNNVSTYDTYYAVVKPDDYRLWRGMEDLV